MTNNAKLYAIVQGIVGSQTTCLMGEVENWKKKGYVIIYENVTNTFCADYFHDRCGIDKKQILNILK